MSIEPKVGLTIVAEAPEPEPLEPAGRSPRPRTRLDELRDAIERGTYVVDLDELAARIVGHELLRGATVRGGRRAPRTFRAR
jgi:hypothetical protein